MMMVFISLMLPHFVMPDKCVAEEAVSIYRFPDLYNPNPAGGRLFLQPIGVHEDQVLEGTYSQYLSPKLMWDSILRHEEKIINERPEIFEKIKKNRELTLGSTNI